MKEFTRPRAAGILPGRTSHVFHGTASRLDRVHFLAGVLAIGLTAYVTIEPTYNWLLLLLAGLTALGTDAVVRAHPKARFHGIDDTAVFLFVPVLFTLSMGLFFEEVASGPVAVLAGVGSVVPYWFILRAEFQSVDREAADYQFSRLVLNGATYVTAFLFFAAIYDFDLSLSASSAAAGVVGLLLAIEVLREEAVNLERTVVYAIAVGALLAEAAWATHFLPLEGSAPAVFLLLGFYLTTGLVHNYMAGRLTARTGTEFAGVAGFALAIVCVWQILV